MPAVWVRVLSATNDMVTSRASEEERMPVDFDLVAAVSDLRSGGGTDRPYRHQALLLLWAIGRARSASPRLVRWSSVRTELTELLARFGLPENQATPEYPFVALNDPRLRLWEVLAPGGAIPKAHGSEPLRWLNTNDPLGGLREQVYDFLATDDARRATVVAELLNRYFKQESAADLLVTVGLLGPPDAGGNWTLRPGDVARRKTIHARYGGEEQGDISTPTTGGRTLLFADPTGVDYGCNDGWMDDGSYHYRGQGTLGDQRFTAANQAVIDPDREIHLFEAAVGTVVRYVGRFSPDKQQPYYREDSVDVAGDLRSIIVFRLWPHNGAIPSPSQPTGHVNLNPGSTLIPIEAHNTPTYNSRKPKEPAVYERRESELVRRYVSWLRDRGEKVMRNSIPQIGQPHCLLTDLFNVTTSELVEAKGGATRVDVRNALAQLLDYSRSVEHNSLAALLPVLPATDLVDLLTLNGINCVYELPEGGFDRVAATPRTWR